MRPSVRTRGFTLVELMATLAIGSIVGTGIVAVAAWQMRSYVSRLAQLDARAQAQTIVAAIADPASRAGYGFGHASDAVGVPATGVCRNVQDYSPGWPYGVHQPNCAGLDNGGKNDRLRFAYIDPGQMAYLATSAPTSGPCGTDTSVPDPSRIHLADLPTTVFNNATSVEPYINLFIGGACQDGGPPSAATDEIAFPAAAGAAQAQCREIRAFTTSPDVSGGPNGALLCPNGYAAGFAMGVAETREFYTDTDPVSGLPRLMMGAQCWGQLPAVVAVGVTRFEVRYAFDTSSERDHKLHPCPTCSEDPYGTALGGPRAWCREVRAADRGGSCVLYDDAGNVLDTAALRARVLAVHVTFDLVAPPQTGASIKQIGLTAGAPTWTFQRLFYLPNMAT